MQEIVNPIINRAEEYICRELGIGVLKYELTSVVSCLTLVLEDYTILFELSGALKGLFIMSYSDELARTLVSKFVIDEVSEEEIEEYAGETVAEISNTILGNSLDKFPEVADNVHLSIPKPFNEKVYNLDGNTNAVWVGTLQTVSGILRISFVKSI